MSYDAPDEAPVAPSLLDLIGRRWALDGAVSQAVFNRDGSTVAFAAEGGLGLAPVADPERAEARIRVSVEDGRHSIQPRRNPPRPVERAAGVRGPVAPFGARTFVSGRAAGGLASVTARGQVTPLSVPVDGPPTALAADPGSEAVAVAGAGGVAILREGGAVDRLALDAGLQARALAFAPDGAWLAAAHDAGVSIWRRGGAAQVVVLPEPAHMLSVSPDGAWLAAGCGEGGFALVRISDGAAGVVGDFPASVRSVGWSAAAGALVASGAYRVAAWERSEDGLSEPLESGKPGLVIVERVAASPDRPLAAAGYASGLLCLSQIGGRGEMLLRDRGAPLTALAFSADGAHLAYGDAAGEIALVSFPPSLFKEGPAR